MKEREETVEILRDRINRDGAVTFREVKALLQAYDDLKAEARDVVSSLCYQYMDRTETDNGLALDNMFMSAGENAFDFMGWMEHPCFHLIPEAECEVVGCHKSIAAGFPGRNARYHRLCREHYAEIGEVLNRDTEPVATYGGDNGR